MWSYITGGLKIKVIEHRKLNFGTKSSSLIIKGGLKMEGCKIEGLLYMIHSCRGRMWYDLITGWYSRTSVAITHFISEILMQLRSIFMSLISVVIIFQFMVPVPMFLSYRGSTVH